MVHLEGDGPGGDVGGRLGCRVGECDADFDVAREALHPVDEAPALVECADLEALAERLAEAEHPDVAGVELRHVDHDSARILVERLDVERLDDRLEGRVDDRLVDRERVGRHELVGGDPEQDPVIVSLPADRLRVVLHAAEAETLRRLRATGDEQHLSLEHRFGDLEQHLLLDAVHDEHPRVRDGLLRDDLGVRLHLLLLFRLLLVGSRLCVGRLVRAETDRAAAEDREHQGCRAHKGPNEARSRRLRRESRRHPGIVVLHRLFVYSSARPAPIRPFARCPPSRSGVAYSPNAVEPLLLGSAARENVPSGSRRTAATPPKYMERSNRRCRTSSSSTGRPFS